MSNKKSHLNKDGWYSTRGGLKRDAPGENGKNLVTVPWNFLKKRDTGIGGLKRVTSTANHFDLLVLDKAIGQERIVGTFDTKREALKYYDIALIKRGREPKYILKKL